MILADRVLDAGPLHHLAQRLMDGGEQQLNSLGGQFGRQLLQHRRRGEVHIGDGFGVDKDRPGRWIGNYLLLAEAVTEISGVGEEELGVEAEYDETGVGLALRVPSRLYMPAIKTTMAANVTQPEYVLVILRTSIFPLRSRLGLVCAQGKSSGMADAKYFRTDFL